MGKIGITFYTGPGGRTPESKCSQLSHHSFFSTAYAMQAIRKEVPMSAEVFRNIDTKVREALKIRGVQIPDDTPLSEVRKFCDERCQDVCFGPYGVVTLTGATIHLTCGKHGIAEISRKKQTGTVISHLGTP